MNTQTTPEEGGGQDESETVCVGCWRIIEPDDVLYADDEPYCPECYERIEVGEE